MMAASAVSSRPLASRAVAVLLALLLASCSTVPAPIRRRRTPARSAEPVGYGGMALIESNPYLVVHDAKVYEDRPRLGILGITALGPVYAPLTIADWMDPDLALLGERGGSDRYPAGRLRWGWLDLQAASVEWAEMGKASIEVTAPGRWPMTKRDIADLYVDPEGTLWATATADEGVLSIGTDDENRGGV